MESEQSKAAISSLNPLCTLRYSATHREQYNLVYRLGPVAAYDLNLVKHIEVAGVLDQPTFGRPYLQVKSVKATKTRITAQLELDINGANGPKRRTVSVSSNGVDLFDKSGEREAYRGYIISEINAADNFVAFSNGVRLYQGETHGDSKDAVMRFQIETTIREHLEKELRVSRLPEGQRLKVLSLFFIDRVANYNDEDGKIRGWFTEAYTKLVSEPAYADLNLPPVDEVHNGYFATTNKGEAKDTNGSTKADDEAYQLIMKDKERLLERSEPLRFIFSHSALREGWDNPNVFQICTLNETRSEVRKRQEIGRGLRLPVLESGERCFDQAINKLVVIANESYEDFARALQQQIEDETGEQFKERIKPVSERKTARFRSEQLHPYFEALWEKIKYKTRYSVDYDTGELIEKAAKALEEMGEIAAPKVQLQKVSLEFSDEGIETKLRAVREDGATPQPFAIPDLIGYLQKEIELTRGTLAQILVRSNRLDDVEKNPQQFLDNATKLIKATLHRLMIDGIKYHRLENQAYEMGLFKKEIEGYESNMLPVSHSIYDAVIYDSSVERDFAEGLDGRADDTTDEMKFYFKLPDWFKISTPIGNYNPDWGIVRENGKRLYLIRETKSVTDLNLASAGQLRGSEEDKIICGKRHFDALVEVDYAVTNSPSSI